MGLHESGFGLLESGLGLLESGLGLLQIGLGLHESGLGLLEGGLGFLESGLGLLERGLGLLESGLGLLQRVLELLDTRNALGWRFGANLLDYQDLLLCIETTPSRDVISLFADNYGLGRGLGGLRGWLRGCPKGHGLFALIRGQGWFLCTRRFAKRT
eukprot:1391889-Amorphochlora_amoeboformis.AAC.4